MNDPLSLDEVQQLRASQKLVERILSEVKDSTTESWRKLAGAAADLMLEERNYALGRLDDSEPKIRQVALNVLAFHWNSVKDQDFQQRCEEMAFQDLNDSVRAVAIRLLGECYQNTDDVRIGKLLAQVVNDERQSCNCRSGAYLALFRLRGVFADWPGRHSIPVTHFSFPDHVDWQLVNSFLDDTRVPKKV